MHDTARPTAPTDLAGLAGDVLGLVGDDVEAQVRVMRTRLGLTRFANSFVHQHVDEDTTLVDVRLADDGRAASARTSDLDPEALRRLVTRLRETARTAPRDPHHAGFAPPDDESGPLPDLDRFDAATAENDPDVRAELVRTFVAAGGSGDDATVAAGYCDTEALEVAYANTHGRSATGRTTRATLDGIHQAGTAAGAGHQTAIAVGDLDAETVAATAHERALQGRGAEDVDPGLYEVVLGPEAVATILVFLGFYGFNAKNHLEGQSAIRLGESQFDSSITIRDALDDPRVISLPFDAEGTARRDWTLVAGGTATSLVHDRRTAARCDTRSTGHAIDGGGSWGPVPNAPLLEPGSTSPQVLVEAVPRGLYIAAFNYCRVLDPKSLVVTGLTRNGTFLVEDGRITRPVSNLRFTQSFVTALGEGNVLGIGDDDRYADSEFGPGVCIAPSLRLGSFNVTGGAGG